MLISRHLNAGQKDDIKTAGRSYEDLGKLKYLFGKIKIFGNDSKIKI
jgi:hypothetical protein